MPTPQVRMQVAVQVVVLALVLLLTTAALVSAVSSSNKADAGQAACTRLIATYASSNSLRQAIKDEFLVNAHIRRQTAAAYRSIAKLAPKGSVARTQIGRLAGEYDGAAASSLIHAGAITFPAQPDC